MNKISIKPINIPEFKKGDVIYISTNIFFDNICRAGVITKDFKEAQIGLNKEDTFKLLKHIYEEIEPNKIIIGHILNCAKVIKDENIYRYVTLDIQDYFTTYFLLELPEDLSKMNKYIKITEKSLAQ